MCMYEYTRVCIICTCVHACVFVCMYVCLSLSGCIHVCACIHTNVHIPMCVNMFGHVDIQVGICMYALINTCKSVCMITQYLSDKIFIILIITVR